MLRKNKMGQTQLIMAVIAIFLITELTGISNITPIRNVLEGGAAQVGAVVQSNAAQVGKSNIIVAPEDVTVSLQSFDLKNKGTSTGGQHYVWVEGTRKSNVNDGSTFVASGGDQLMILFNANHSENTNPNGFYPNLLKVTVPQTKGTFDIQDFAKGKPSTNITISLFNDDDDLKNTATDAQALTTSETRTMKLKLRTSSRDYFGDDTVVCVFDANQNAFTDVRINGGKKVSAPGQHSAVANTRAYAWEIPALVETSFAEYSLDLETGNTEPTSAHNISVTCYDSSLYLDAETGEIIRSYNDENFNDVGFSQGTQTIYIS